MWLITQTGFISLVQDRKDHSKVWVRARIKEDIANTFPEYADKIITKIGADYIYRLIVPKDVAALVMWNAVQDVDYDSHAKEVMNRRSHPNSGRMTAYYAIWTALAKLQPFAPYSHTPRPVGKLAPLTQAALPGFSSTTGTATKRDGWVDNKHYDWSTHPHAATGYRNGKPLTDADYNGNLDGDWPMETGDAVDLIHGKDDLDADPDEWVASDGTVFDSLEDWENYLETRENEHRGPKRRNPRRNRRNKNQAVIAALEGEAAKS